MTKEPTRRSKDFEDHSRILDIMTSHMVDMAYYKDKAFRYIFSSKPHCDRILKCSQEECVGLTDVEIAERYRQSGHEQGFGEICIDSDQQTREAGKPGQYVEVANIDGEEIWLEVHKTPYYDETGAFAGIIGCSREITERIQTERRLRDSEERYRLVVENASDFIMVTQDGMLKFANSKMSEASGYSDDALASLPFVHFIHPDDRDMVMQHHWKRLKGEEEPENYDFRVVYKDGVVTWVESRAVLITWEDKPATLNFLTDITARKQAEDELQKDHDQLERRVEERTVKLTETNNQLRKEIEDRKRKEEALRESEEKYRQLFEMESDAVFLIETATGLILEVNGHASALYGYSRDELLQMTNTDVSAEPADTRKAAKRRQNRIPVRYHKKKNGTVFPVEIAASHFTWEGREVHVAAIRDITERLNAEEEKKKLESQLLQAHKMEAIGTLAGGIAHDFNNLLMGIQGNTSLIQFDIDPDHPHLERLKDIEEAVKRGAELTGQLLGFARGGKYEVKPLDLNFTIQKTSQMFGRANKEVTIACGYQKNIWPVEVDRGQIEQVLLNLYVNAGQAMPEGGDLYLQTENVTLTEENLGPLQIAPGRYVKASVTDTGVGMDEKTQQRIFDPFFTTKEMGRGTGLGLAAAYGIIKNHGGFIDVHSEKGKGTTFIICLPASEKRIEESREISEPEAVKGEETVLLVDDEDLIITVGAELLKTLGYNTLVARSGKEALEIYKESKNSIDLIILDMIMPEMGGGETYDRLKEINPALKVLLATGYSLDSPAKEILELGCNGFIQKPFDMKQLSGKIREILENNRE